MFDYGLFSFASKEEVIEQSIRSWNPGKTRFWQEAGVDLVIDRRKGYFIYDMSGRRLIDLHLNGGTYNLGHRNSDLVRTLKEALDHFDMGNHWFPSIARAALAEKLLSVSPGFAYPVYSAGGAEAVDVAIKCARFATQRRKVVSILKGYHGHSGLSVATGDERFSRIFLSDQPDLFEAVPFNDLGAMEEALKGKDVAAVIVETIPATYGFPMPREGYHQGVRALCDRYGTMLIADEVQTGLMRTGVMWGFQSYGFQPDIFVTAKGISGGLYPISATLLSERAGAWLNIDGAAHISTTGGSELGCCVAWKVIDMLEQPKVARNVAKVSRFFAEGMAQMMKRHADFFVGVRQRGVVMGLEFAGPDDAVHVSRALYENGIWAIFSSLDKRVLQFKPGLLLKRKLCEEILERFDAAMPRAKELSAAAHAAGKGARSTPARKRARKAA